MVSSVFSVMVLLHFLPGYTPFAARPMCCRPESVVIKKKIPSHSLHFPFLSKSLSPFNRLMASVLVSGYSCIIVICTSSISSKVYGSQGLNGPDCLRQSCGSIITTMNKMATAMQEGEYDADKPQAQVGVRLCVCVCESLNFSRSAKPLFRQDKTKNISAFFPPPPLSASSI